MGLSGTVTRRIIGRDDSLATTLRRRRWEQFAATFPDLEQMHVVDIGGEAAAWLEGGIRPARLTLVNVTTQPAPEPWMRSVVEDGCNGLAVTGDLAYSNSVIEHVGGHWRRERFAETVHRVAAHHWVQTPYRYFPVEPHWLCPGLQHLPRPAQAKILSWWPLGETNGSPIRDALGVELLSLAEMRAYFPDSEIRREKVAGLTKSLVAVSRRP